MLEKKYSDEKEHYGLFKGIYERNEMFLIASAAIFFGSMFAGYLLSGIIDQFLAGELQSLKQGVSSGQIQITTISIFANNIKIAFFTYASGIIFGLGPVIYLFYQGLFIGYTASKFSTGDFIIYTLPHGVFEVAGIIIAGAAGFRLASCVVHVMKDARHIKRYIPAGEQIEQILHVNYWEFKESVLLFIIAAVLIFIAAIIEANFTIAWANYIKGTI